MATYLGETVKSLVATDPPENNPPSEINDSIREIKRVLKNIYAIATKTANYTLTAQDEIIFTNGAITVTLPAGSSVAGSGFLKRYILKNVHASSNATISPNGAETIQGASSRTLAPGEIITLVSDGGTNWLDITAFALQSDFLAHGIRHISGGADAFTSTQLLEAIVKRLRESGGSDLLIGAVVDGQILKRDGTGVKGSFPKVYFAQVTSGGTSSLGYAAIGAGLSVTFTPQHATNIILIDVMVDQTGVSVVGTIGLFLDGSLVTNAEVSSELAGKNVLHFPWRVANLSAASHTFELKWKVSGGTIDLISGGAILRVLEIS